MRKEETKIAFYDHYFYATVVLCCKEPGCTVRRAGLPLAERCACPVRTVCTVHTDIDYLVAEKKNQGKPSFFNRVFFLTNTQTDNRAISCLLLPLASCGIVE